MDENPRNRLEGLKKDLFVEEKRAKLRKLQERVEDEKTWLNWEEGQKVAQDLAEIKKDVEDYEILELLAEEDTPEKFEEYAKKLEIKSFLSGKHDLGNAIVSVHAGQGGTEAMDWAEMLYRMYHRYAESSKWKLEKIDSTAGEITGYKSITFSVAGKYAYGFLKNESGVHRLVRLSPFNADNLRQTSFALVEVIPEIDDTVEVEIKEEDVEFESFRSSGSGGQNVNKVSTAVRIKHKPTNIIVECQEERTQGKNREKAMKLLKSKIYALRFKEMEAEKLKLKGIYKTPGWGNQIRNYVLHPYKLVKDLRTGVESTNPEAVLDGELAEFIEEEIRLGTGGYYGEDTSDELDLTSQAPQGQG